MIHIDGIGEVLFKKSRRARKINISVKPFEGIVVSFPYYVSYKVAEEVAVSKIDWLKKSIDKIKNYENKKVLYDESTDFSTRRHELAIQKRSSDDISIYITQGKISVKYPSDMDVHSELVQNAIKFGIERALRIEAKEYLPMRVDRLAEEFGFGYNRVYCKNLKSRWGSCSAKNNINLNIHLMRLSDELVDYVILHELCHTIHKNHSKRFWDKLESVFPGSKSADKKLREFSARTIT
ncbi:Putative predicted metal-dependent hydrolase [hydrothermal vent metagenome]|uniref:Predicted metal-dependent hydrolase n=1 Tax=hydrothermal vent metagenome TaxID=652676 RepID=A0A3B1BXB2_9ZZZZ